MTGNEFKVFIDFDGTITMEDVGDKLFRQFGSRQKVDKLIDNLLSDSISARKCWIELCNTIEFINEEDLNNLIDGIQIDPYFHKFIGFCKAQSIDHYILSDGFDYYMNRILSRENLDDIIFFSNSLSVSGGKLVPSFPYFDNDFPWSANCKRNHIINLSSDEEFTVFIGDGNSDKDTIEFCDYIFAKDDLLKYCEKHRISYFPFKDFSDVIFIMEKLLSRKRLKKRHRAVLKRKEAYMQE